MIYFNFSERPAGINVAAYCETPVERIYLYGLLAAGMSGADILSNKVDFFCVEDFESPLQFMIYGPIAIDALINYLIEHEIVFCLSTDHEIKLRSKIGPIHSLSSDALILGPNFSNISSKQSAGARAYRERHLQSVQDEDNWVWFRKVPAKLRKACCI